MAPAGPDRFDDETQRLLVRRLRAGLWLAAICVVAFALSDPVTHPQRVRQLYMVFVVELAVLLGALGLLRVATRRAHAIAIAFTAVSALCVTTALSGIIVGDSATTPVLLLVLSLGT